MAGSAGERALQEKFGTTKRAQAFYDNQMLTYLNDTMKAFVAKQDMVFVSTADGGGNCDCSIRTGQPGFVQVIDEKTLAYPEFRGNGVMASLGNMTENPHVGLLFIDFVEHGIGLHVNGSAEIVENGELQARLNLPDERVRAIEREVGGLAERWVCVRVEEAYIHCSKHIPLFHKRDKEMHWGTDDETYKGGDFFSVRSEKGGKG
jgi:uncharacterized protein